MASQRQVTADEKHLVQRRPAQILSLLAPIASSFVTPRRVPQGSALIIAAVTGSPLSDDFRDWTFDTKVTRFSASYYERWWQSKTNPERYSLERAYLHLQCQQGQYREPRQVLALHCEPAPASSGVSENAMATHLHLSMSSYPLDKAHFCLESGRLAEICASLTALTNSLLRATTLIEEEVLRQPDLTRLLKA